MLLGLSESVAGVTFLAFGNGSPDVFSTFAAMSSNSGSLAIGELIGAAGFISAVVAGSMALVRPFRVAKKSFLRDVSFFVVAASFSMVFLADGRLTFWECAVMVAFYITYVVFVVAWHWVDGRKRRRKQKEAQARNHFLIVGHRDNSYEDEIDDEGPQSGTPDNDRNLIDDFATLEGASRMKAGNIDEEDRSEAREQWMAEIHRNMRVQRPSPRPHRNTGNPIRPSLVGALEFRAVLSSLGKSRIQQAIPIGFRRYSDDPNFTLAQQQQHYHNRATSNPNVDASFHQDISTQRLRPSGARDNDDSEWRNRNRAVSANDADAIQPRLNRGQELGSLPENSDTKPTVAFDQIKSQRHSNLVVPGQVEASLHSEQRRLHRLQDATPATPTIQRSGDQCSRSFNEPSHQQLLDNNNRLQPDRPRFSFARQSSNSSLLLSPGTGASSPATPFPLYHDDPTFISNPSRPSSIRLPSPDIDSGPFLTSEETFATMRPVRWWPYRLLPPPRVLFSTLFPTLYSWREKTFGERALGIISAPTIFLLTITLPVVELENGRASANTSFSETNSNVPANAQTANFTDVPILVNTSSETEEHEGTASPQADFATTSLVEDMSFQANDSSNGIEQTQVPIKQPVAPSDAKVEALDATNGWNRWLVSTQIFTAPLFVVVVLWANIDDQHSLRNLLFDISCTLVGSLLVLAALLLATDEQKIPKYQALLCFVGFVVSVAWISTIAGEVVGVLKALGVILGISDAILGLTIFAVGNR